MFKVNPYNTSAGRVVNIDKLKSILREYIVLHGNSPLFNHITMPIKTIFISGLISMEKDIPMFNLPIMMEDTRGDTVVVIDIRGILKSKVTVEEINNSLISEVLKNEAEYSFTIIRAYLMESYIEKILEPLTEKFETMNPKSIADLVNTISICLTPITDKLKNLNSISLNQMLLSSWYGENSNETISIALEHPPTFAGLCYLSLNNNSYKATKISNIINAKLKNKKDFALNLNSILRNTNFR